MKVYGDWLPRTIFGKFTAMCAILRMIYLAIMLYSDKNSIDVVLLDGVSAPIPIIQVNQIYRVYLYYATYTFLASYFPEFDVLRLCIRYAFFNIYIDYIELIF